MLKNLPYENSTDTVTNHDNWKISVSVLRYFSFVYHVTSWSGEFFGIVEMSGCLVGIHLFKSSQKESAITYCDQHVTMYNLS